MRHIIEKTTFVIQEIPDAHVVDPLTNYDNSRYALIPKVLVDEIKTVSEYVDGTTVDDAGDEVDNIIYLPVVQALEYNTSEDFDEVIGVIYKDIDTVVYNYKLKKLTAEFAGYEYKIFIQDVLSLVGTPYQVLMDYVNNHPDIRVDREVKGKGAEQVVEACVYCNYIKGQELTSADPNYQSSHWFIINNAVNSNGNLIFNLRSLTNEITQL